MISNVVALGMVGMAAAAYAPPAYGAPAESSSSAPVAPVYSAPATTSAPVAPVYSAPAASSSSSTFACNPAHQYPGGEYCTEVSGSLTLLTSTTAPVAEATTYVTYCSEATTLTWYSTTIPVPHPTTLTLTHTVPAPAKPTYSVDIPVSHTSVAPVWTTSAPVAPVYSAPVWTSSAPVAPVYSAPAASSPVAPVYPVHNATTPAPSATGSYPHSPVSYTGAGARVAVGAFAGAAGVLAFFL